MSKSETGLKAFVAGAVIVFCVCVVWVIGFLITRFTGHSEGVVISSVFVLMFYVGFSKILEWVKELLIEKSETEERKYITGGSGGDIHADVLNIGSGTIDAPEARRVE